LHSAGLRVQNDEVVRVGPLVDAGFLHKLLLNCALVLQASMERDN
jgi:hypothetical protein